MEHTYIYLVFTKTNTWLSKIIGFVSKIEYPHASISLDNSFTRMYSFGRIDPDNPFSGGFTEENLFEGLFKKSGDCRCLIYRLKVDSSQYSAVQAEVSAFMHRREVYRYNLMGLVGVWFNMPIKRRNHYFCSQFVSEVLIRSQLFHDEKLPELIKTDDLYLIKNKELVYEGPVLEYRTFVPTYA